MLSQALSETISKLARTDGRPVEWAVSRGYVGYDEAVAAMEARAAAISAGEAGELIWLLEHPPLYTAGVSSKDDDLLDAGRFPVHRSGRGGQFTYHGPGQRVAYVMLDLNQRGKDVRAFVRGLEQWIIGALAEFGVTADVREGRVGVWVERKGPGWLPWHQPERRAGPGPFQRHRAMRHRRAWRDQSGRSRRAGDDGRGGRGAADELQAGVRGSDGGGCAALVLPSPVIPDAASPRPG